MLKVSLQLKNTSNIFPLLKIYKEKKKRLYKPINSQEINIKTFHHSGSNKDLPEDTDFLMEMPTLYVVL